MKKELEIENVNELVDRLLANPIFTMARGIFEQDDLLKQLIQKSNKISKKEENQIYNKIIELRDNFSSESPQHIDCIFYIGQLLRYQIDTEKNLRGILNTISQKGKQIYESKFNKI